VVGALAFGSAAAVLGTGWALAQRDDPAHRGAWTIATAAAEAVIPVTVGALAGRMLLGSPGLVRGAALGAVGAIGSLFGSMALEALADCTDRTSYCAVR
jgi:hypothetical protein